MDKSVQALRDELARAERKMRLIQERKEEFILRTDIPLALIDAEREWEGKIADLKAKLEMAQPDDAQQNNELQFPIFYVPFHRNPNFAGREDTLAILTQNLSAGNTTVLVQTMAGLGGVGKTQSAVEFAYRHAADYDLVWWIRTENDELFSADYATLISRLNLPVKTAVDKNILINLVRGWLAATAQRWLLIFDNAETAEQLQDVLPAQGNGHVIITSRNPNWRHLGNVLQLNEFSLAEASAFLIKRTGDTNQAAAEQVAELLGKLPLALEQAAAFMSERGMPLTTYATLYVERRQELWQRATPPRNYPATVLTTWEIAFQQVQQANPAAAHLLNLCAFLAPDNISITMIRFGAAGLSPTLQATLENMLEVEEMLATLYRYSLISRKEETITIHRLVQEVTQDRLHKEEKERWLEAAIHLVNQFFPFDQYNLETWAASGNILPHLITVVNHAEKQKIEPELVATLWQKAAYYLNEQGEYAKAQSVTELALKTRSILFGEDHLVTAESLDFLGQLQREQTNYSHAQLCHERALRIRQASLGQEHEDTAKSLNNLGYLFQEKGEYQKAQDYYEAALAIRQHILGDNHPDTAVSLNNLGLIFQLQGKYEQAHFYYEATLMICRQVLGNFHPNTATALHNLGFLAQAKGNYDMAYTHYETALTNRREILGSNHPDTANTLSNLGTLCQAQGDYKQAHQYHQEALEIRRKVLGSNHSATALSIDNLGALLHEHGKYEQARIYHEEALTIFRQVLGNHHPDTISCLNNLGCLLQSLGKCEHAYIYHKEALEISRQVLGNTHPDTAMGLNNLGTLLQSQGKYEEARIHLEEALAIRRQVLGTNHPDSVASLNNLGLLLQAQGKHEQARNYYEEALEICQQTLGDNHADTATSLNNLGSLLQAQREYEKARAYYEKALAIHQQVLGNNHLDTATSLNNLGSLLLAQGQLVGARLYLEWALHIYDALLIKNHPQLVTLLYNLGIIMLHLKQFILARQYLTRAYNICQNTNGVYAVCEKVKQSLKLVPGGVSRDKSNKKRAAKRKK